MKTIIEDYIENIVTNHMNIISEILLLMKNSPERCAFLLKAGMDNKRTQYEKNDYKSSKLYFQ